MLRRQTPMSTSSLYLCHRKCVIQALLYSFIFCHLIAGGLMVFLAVSRLSSFEADDGRLYRLFGWRWVTKKKIQLYVSSYNIQLLMQIHLEWKKSGKNCTAKLIYPNRNRTVWYLAVSTHTLGPVLLRRGVLEVKGFASSMWCVRHLVWQRVFTDTVLTTTLEVILFNQSFHLHLDPGYRVYPAGHTKCSVLLSASTWYRQLNVLPGHWEHIPVKTSICWSSRGSATWWLSWCDHVQLTRY